jgi:hypothetical protein
LAQNELEGDAVDSEVFPEFVDRLLHVRPLVVERDDVLRGAVHGRHVSRVVVPDGIPQVALGIFGVAPAGENDAPRPAPAAAAKAEFGNLDRRGRLGVDHAPAPLGRVGPDAAGEVGHDPQLDHVVPAAPLAPGVQGLAVEPAIGPDEDRPSPTAGQPGHGLAQEGDRPCGRAGVARAQLTVDR